MKVLVNQTVEARRRKWSWTRAVGDTADWGARGRVVQQLAWPPALNVSRCAGRPTPSPVPVCVILLVTDFLLIL